MRFIKKDKEEMRKDKKCLKKVLEEGLEISKIAFSPKKRFFTFSLFSFAAAGVFYNKSYYNYRLALHLWENQPINAVLYGFKSAALYQLGGYALLSSLLFLSFHITQKTLKGEPLYPSSSKE